MQRDIELQVTAARRYAGVRRRVKHDAIGRTCGEILPRLRQWLAEKGVTPDGPPAVVYHHHHPETGEFDLAPAYFVTASVAGEGDITVGETAAGEVLVTTHVGPYDELGKTWDAVFARAAALGRRVTQSAWEIYVDEPGSVPPAELRTEIVVPLDPV